MSESKRISDNYAGQRHWQQWGPYLSERQWGTVREDYSSNGDAWNYFPHDHARSRAYRWGEDGLAGISDINQNLCFALALWNGKDAILKERLFGLTGPQGNHGEDVKELYYYLDNVPTHSYMEYLYKYPQQAYPYGQLEQTNAHRSRHEPEFELLDTGLFDEGKYFDVHVTYAKAAWDDLLIQITVSNRSQEEAPIWILPTLWFRNLWSFGQLNRKPLLRKRPNEQGALVVEATHPELGTYMWYAQADEADYQLWTENETNFERIFGGENKTPFVKDAFHTAVIENTFTLYNEQTSGTKCAPVYHLLLNAGETRELRLRLTAKQPAGAPLGEGFTEIMQVRKQEADEFYAAHGPEDAQLAQIYRQAMAGMFWTKQYYNLDMLTWLEGDPGQPKPKRQQPRNTHWRYLNNADIISMPDKWEYPWYAVWDLAFHCIPLALLDPQFAKDQLIVVLREWYMHPNGQIPAYEWNFSDVNPPVHAYATLKVYHIDKARSGKPDVDFLKRVFQKLMLNFTWWVNRKDSNGNNVFEGGFLGLDNIGVFDRSEGLPGGGVLEQADGTSWMATFSLNMMEMALEIAQYDPSFEDMATKFLEHFTYIAETLNTFGPKGKGLWDEKAGFYFDQLSLPNGGWEPVKVRSLVGLSPMFATALIPKALQEKVPDFMKRLRWFQDYRQSQGHQPVWQVRPNGDLLFTMVPLNRLKSLLKAMLDEHEFLAPGGIRSLSKYHERHYYELTVNGETYGLRYEPAESSTPMFGGNSNWRGPVWFPMNYMLIQALYTYCDFFESKEKVAFPTGSSHILPLTSIANEISKRLIGMFVPDGQGYRPIHGDVECYAKDPHFKDLILFYEYFHGDNSQGIGASHQTGWTGLVAVLIDRLKGG